MAALLGRFSRPEETRRRRRRKPARPTAERTPIGTRSDACGVMRTPSQTRFPKVAATCRAAGAAASGAKPLVLIS